MNMSQTLSDSVRVLQAYLLTGSEELDDVIHRAHTVNPWFIPDFTRQAIEAIAKEFLSQDKMSVWLEAYSLSAHSPKNIGLIMAGNVPLVGFHDLFCVLVSGHNALVKLSDKDPYLLPHIVEVWKKIDPALEHRITFTEKLNHYDAVIATGSNNSARYFEYYFRSYPHILRQNRNGIAVLTGDESVTDLKQLAKDIFTFFGLGCRNVSKIYVPEGYAFDLWEEAIAEWKHLSDHNKYRNNLDYNYAIFIINAIPHIQLGHLILKEDEAIASRIGCVHYVTYRDTAEVAQVLKHHRDEIQCVISRHPIEGWEPISFGQGQRPSLYDYADDVDTMQFLTSL